MIDVASRIDLAGWNLAWARLVATGGGGAELAARRERVAAALRTRWTPAGLGEDPVVGALRRLFKAAGTDPGRYRPSSEALLRRVLKGDELPRIHPLVDLNNLLSLELKVPCCVLRDGSFAPPVVLRAGRPGETLDSMRGELDLAGKPLLADERGPFGTPVSDAHRVKVLPETTTVWLVAYLPRGGVTPEQAQRALDAILAEAPVARRS